MKYIIGSLIISFAILFVVMIVVMAMGIQAPDDLMQNLGWAWLILAVVTYPLARKIIRA